MRKMLHPRYGWVHETVWHMPDLTMLAGSHKQAVYA